MVICIIRDITKKKKEEIELQEKLDEFEKANKLMAGREKKMAEIKEEIEEIKRGVRNK